MRKKSKFIIVVMALALCVPAIVWSHQGDSLYKRLGGYDALAAVTDDLSAALLPIQRSASSLPRW